MFPYAYIGGRLVPSEEAQVSIASPSMQYGLTCFGGMMAYYRNGRFRLLRLRDHYQRLIAGARTMGMDISLTYDEFRSVVRELLDANAPKGDVYIRPFLMTPDACIAPRPGSSFELAAFMMPMDGYYSENDGLHLQISSWRKFPDAALPTKAKAGGCYVNSYLATMQAQQDGYDDALLMDHAGFIVEASVANIAIVYRGRVILPPIGAAQLEGITMRTVIEMLSEEGLTVSHEPIDRSMIYGCDEMWLMGSAVRIARVASVDRRLLAEEGPVVARLKEKFSELIESNHPHVTEV